jgi:hypothetical protein
MLTKSLAEGGTTGVTTAVAVGTGGRDGVGAEVEIGVASGVPVLVAVCFSDWP